MLVRRRVTHIQQMNTKGFVEKQKSLTCSLELMSSKQQIKTRGFEEKQQSSMCLLKYLCGVAHSRSTLKGLEKKQQSSMCFFENSMTSSAQQINT